MNTIDSASQETRRYARRAALSKMTKAQLIRMCKTGIRRPDGGLCYIEGGMYPLEKWRKDEIVSSILNAEYPAEVTR